MDITAQEMQKLLVAAQREREARVRGIQELRRSGAAGSHADRRFRRIRSRNTAVRKAIQEFS